MHTHTHTTLGSRRNGLCEDTSSLRKPGTTNRSREARSTIRAQVPHTGPKLNQSTQTLLQQKPTKVNLNDVRKRAVRDSRKDFLLFVHLRGHAPAAPLPLAEMAIATGWEKKSTRRSAPASGRHVRQVTTSAAPSGRARSAGGTHTPRCRARGSCEHGTKPPPAEGGETGTRARDSRRARSFLLANVDAAVS